MLAILIIIGPHTIFPVCQYRGEQMVLLGGWFEPMRCYWMAWAESALGIMLIVTAIIFFISKQSETKSLISMTAVILGILVILVSTTLIGACPTYLITYIHPCYITQRILIILGAAIIIVNGYGYFKFRRKSK